MMAGGYDYDFIDEVPERHHCMICTKALREPHLTGCCGQNFCHSCLKQWLESQEKEVCPHCRAESFPHMINLERQREIDTLRVHCPNRSGGCLWAGDLSSLRNHLNPTSGDGCLLRRHQCRYCGLEDTYHNITGVGLKSFMHNSKNHYTVCPSFPLDCPNKCGLKMIKRVDVASHREACYLEIIMCPNDSCSERIVRHQYDNHQDKCPMKAIYCSNECGKRIKRMNMAAHRRDQCPLELIICPNVCAAKQIKRKDMTAHRDQCPLEPINCPNLCGAKEIKRMDVNAHRNQCPLEPISCPNVCGAEGIKRKDMTAHKHQCPLELISCPNLCGTKEIKRKDMSAHRHQCLLEPISCPNECGVNGMKRIDMAAHRGKCPMEVIDCPLQEAGCTERILRCNLDEHMQQNTQQHLVKMMKAFKRVSDENERLVREMNELKVIVRRLRGTRM